MSTVISGTSGASKVQDGVVSAPKLDGAQSGDAPVYGCRAWVNFDGTRNVTDTGASVNGQPVLIRASGNVTSVVKNATGDYTVNFTTAMPDANYSAVASVNSGGSAYASIDGNTPISNVGVGGYATASVRVRCAYTSNSSSFDSVAGSVTIFR